MLKEFKEFALKGNVLDLAVGVIIGASFGKIVTSFVNDVLTPPLGLIVGKVDFSNLFINLSGQHYESLSEAKRAGAATINLGLFANTVIDFAFVAIAIFMLVKAVNKMKKGPGNTKPCAECLSPIPYRAKRCSHCAQLQPAN